MKKILVTGAGGFVGSRVMQQWAGHYELCTFPKGFLATAGEDAAPISDTTIMASAGAHCSHVNHVSTQLPYAITAASCSAACYVITGLTQMFLGSSASLWTSLILLGVAIVLELVVLNILRVKLGKKTKA